MKRLQLITRVDPELREAVSKAAGDEGISINDLVIKALENYLGIPKDRSDNTVDNSSAITTLAERITALESNAINGDNSTAITTAIDDRFQALESKIKAIREELKAIVNAGKSPKKTEPQTAKTIAPGVGTIDKVDWISFIAEFPGKNFSELSEIAKERYPEKETRSMKEALRKTFRKINQSKPDS